MTDRKNIKVDEPTFERLAALKGQYETWPGLLNRAADALEDD